MIPEIIGSLVDGGKFLKACSQATLDVAHMRLNSAPQDPEAMHMHINSNGS